ncbi:MAG: TatD family hydrolase [Thermoprotei archaeon]
METLCAVDVHCHLDDPLFDNDIESVISDARNKGIKNFVISAMLDLGIERALMLASKYPWIYLSLGVQPQYVTDNNWKDLVNQFHEKLSSKFIAVGEVGLDRGREGGEITAQEKFFREALRTASSKKLPVVVHSRGAGRNALSIIYEEKASVPVIMHAYDGRVSSAVDAVKHNVFFSIPPSIIRSEQKLRLVHALPLNSMLLESDAPALGPNANERNVPSNVLITANVIAKEKRVGLENAINTMTENAQKIFNVNFCSK